MESYLDQARKGKSGLIRFIIGIAIIYFFIYIVGGILQEVILTIYGAPVDLTLIPSLVYFFLIMCPGICGLAGLFITVRYVHQRPFRSLITSFERIKWKPILYGFGLLFLLLILSSLISYGLNPSNFSFNSNNIIQFLTFLPFILVMIPLQTTSEELTYRGYWLQGAGILTRNFLVLGLISGVLFLLPHLLNPEITSGGILMMVYFVVVGFSLAFISLKSGTLELAIGMHAANNIYESAIIHPGTSILETPSLFAQGTTDPITSLISITAIMIIFYLITFRLKPKWKNKDSHESIQGQKAEIPPIRN